MFVFPWLYVYMIRFSDPYEFSFSLFMAGSFVEGMDNDFPWTD